MQLEQQLRCSGSRPADCTQTPTGRGYVNQKHINKKISVSISEGLSSAVSLQNRQLRTTLPAIMLQTNSETVKVSPQTRKNHSKYDAHTTELPTLLPKQLVRLQDPSSKKWSILGEVLQKSETPNSYVVKTPKGVLRRNWIHIKEAAMLGPPSRHQQQHQWHPSNRSPRSSSQPRPVRYLGQQPSLPRSQFQSPLAQCKFQTSHRTPPRRHPHSAGPTE